MVHSYHSNNDIYHSSYSEESPTPLSEVIASLRQPYDVRYEYDGGLPEIVLPDDLEAVFLSNDKNLGIHSNISNNTNHSNSDNNYNSSSS